tara:strand:+ start:508 stop:690 length:183 start_codon:yes stop_codon:yes gene_type:complete
MASKVVQAIYCFKAAETVENEALVIIKCDDGEDYFWNKDTDRSELDAHTKSIVDAFFNGI